ncbi:MAG: hypothetical protein M1837_005997 [Sclerophora amabilis]|nr:MAG: hypothetical protein M1837_005997 [Sclerophora amabilis]
MPEEGHMMKTLPQATVFPRRSPVIQQSFASRDESDLAHFGKQQQFKYEKALKCLDAKVGWLTRCNSADLGRVFGVRDPLADANFRRKVGLTVGPHRSLQALITNGGPTGAFGAYIFVMTGVLMQVLVMAEMASMIPLAGGQYNWVAILAPPAYSKFLSYLTGWVTTIAWQAASASVLFLDATIIQALLAIAHPTYVFERWHGTLIFYGLLALTLFFNTYLGRLLPNFEATILVFHVAGFVGILITILYLAPKSTPSAVFQQFVNGGKFDTNAESFFVGTVSSMYAFIGIDAATHMAEEIENASVVIPRSMIVSVFLNGTLGLGMLVAIMFCMGPVTSVLGAEFFMPFVTVLQSITHSTAGATVMACIILVVGIAGSIGILATTSRMLWAFAREDGVPGSRFIARVEPRTALPLWSIGVAALVDLLLALINIGSTVAFNAFSGLTIAGFYSSFIISAAVMLQRRLTTPSSDIRWGPFQLGRAGVPVTVLALCFSVVGWIFSFWPPTAMVTKRTFNWSIVVYFGTLFIAMIWWVVHARHTYTGPKAELFPARR